MDRPKVYVVVVTYNAMPWLDRCFGSLAASQLPVRTIVVDNGSTDGTVAALRERFPEVETVETGRNLGFGRANNIGMRRALDEGCDYVYLLNQDAWVDPDTIGVLVAVQRADPRYFVLSPLQLAGDRTKMDPNFRERMNEKRCPGLLRDMESGHPEPVYPTRFVMAAHWLLPRASLETVGGFADIFPHYGEDNNYAQRVRYFGYKIGVCPGTVGIHDRGDRAVPPSVVIEKLYTVFLMKACDINRNIFRAYVSAVWNTVKHIPAYTFRYRSLLPFAVFFRGISARRKIMYTRRRTRAPGTNYL